MPSPSSAAPDGNEEPTAAPDGQMTLDTGTVAPGPKTKTPKAAAISAPVDKEPPSAPSAMPQRNSVAPDNDDASRQPPDTLAGVVTHVEVTPEQVRIIMLAAPDFKPATCYVDAATDGPVYEKSKFARVGDRMIVALAPGQPQDAAALRATEVWAAMGIPRWFAP